MTAILPTDRVVQAVARPTVWRGGWTWRRDRVWFSRMNSSHVPCRLVSCSATAQQWADLAASLEAHGSLTCLNLTDGELGGPEAPQVPPAAAGVSVPCLPAGRLCVWIWGPRGRAAATPRWLGPPQGDNACPTSGPRVPLPSRGRWQARGRREGRERGQLSPGRALEPLSRRGTRRLENCHLTGAYCQELSPLWSSTLG